MALIHARGRKGEEIAVHYLTEKGYQIKFRNVKIYRGGEIDIVAFDPVQKELVFAEVKSRTSRRFGWPEESITSQKQKRLLHAVSIFFLKHKQYQSLPYRFDIIAVELDERVAKARITHYKNVTI